ncbi:MAG: phenylacetate--CoA ligase family protein [Nitrospinota bacterium]
MTNSLTTQQARRLRRTVELCGRAHPYYRQKFSEWGLEPGDIRSPEDLASLPLTHKADYMADPEAFRIRPEDLPSDVSTEEVVLWDVAYTTGTSSGRPTPFYNTTHDIYGVLDQARRCNEVEGIGPEDRIANLYPLAGFPTGAFLSVFRSGMICGVPVIYGLTGSAHSEFRVRNSLEEALALVERFRPTTLWGVPSFIRRFLLEAHGRGAGLSAVRLIITSGEPVSTPLRTEFKQRLRAMGAKSPKVLARFAFTEMQGGLVQCAEEAAPQNVVPDLYYLEVADPETGRRLADGESGLLAVTHLHRRGTVLLRYAGGDIVTLCRRPCPHCAHEGERVVTSPRRVSGLVKCRGMLVNPDVIVETLSGLEGVGEFQVVFACEDRPGAMDELIVRVERGASPSSGRSPDGEEGAAETLREGIVRRVREAVSIRPEVEFVPPGELYDPERSIKARRVVDLRPPAKD